MERGVFETMHSHNSAEIKNRKTAVITRWIAFELKVRNIKTSL